MTRRNTQTGITLLEVLLYIATAAILIIGAAFIITNVLSSRTQTDIILEVNTEGNQALQTMTQTIINAESVEVID